MTNDFQQSKHADNMPQRKRHKYLSLFIGFTLIAVALQALSIPSLQASAATVVLVGAGDIASCDYTTDTATAKLLDNISGTVFTAGYIGSTLLHGMYCIHYYNGKVWYGFCAVNMLDSII